MDSHPDLHALCLLHLNTQCHAVLHTNEIFIYDSIINQVGDMLTYCDVIIVMQPHMHANRHTISVITPHLYIHVYAYTHTHRLLHENLYPLMDFYTYSITHSDPQYYNQPDPLVLRHSIRDTVTNNNTYQNRNINRDAFIHRFTNAN